MSNPVDAYPVTRPPCAPPAFLIGHDGHGRWLAVETHGLGGGLFITRDAALHYARCETSRRAGAIVISQAPLSLAGV